MSNTKQKEEQVVTRDIVSVKRSNVLIESKYNSSLLVKKLFALAMTKLELNEDNRLVANISAKEIKTQLNINSHSIYKTLKNLSLQLGMHYIFIEDKEKKSFSFKNIIYDIEYSSGDAILRIIFHDILKKHTLDVERKYTIIPLPVLLSFKSNSSYRLYELLRIYYYKIPDDGIYELDTPLADLKFSLGLIDLHDNKKVTDAMENKVPYEDILDNILKDAQPYKEWTNFRRRILDVAKKEINNSATTEFSFEYEGVTGGAGKRITSVRFFLQKKNGHVYVGKATGEAEPIVDHALVDDLFEALDERISRKEVQTILEAAQGNYELAETVVKAALKNDSIKNPVGWAIRALSENWDISDASAKPDKPKNSFHNFRQRDNNYDEMEKELARAQRKKAAKKAEEEIALESDESGQAILPGVNPEDISEGSKESGIEEMAALLKSLPKDMQEKLADSLRAMVDK